MISLDMWSILEDNIKMELRRKGCEVVDWSRPGKCPLAGFCED
jgi:hypothetical protein